MDLRKPTALAWERTVLNGPFLMKDTTARIVLVLCFLSLQAGCYHYRVVAPKPDPATDYEHRTVHALFWGLVQQDVPSDDCVSNAMDEVRVTTNFGYLVVSVVTLGIWVPLDVEWRCAKIPPSEGEI